MMINTNIDQDILNVTARELTLVCFSIELDLVGLHHFLNRFSNVTQTHINASILQQTGSDEPRAAFSDKNASERGAFKCVCCSRTLIPVLVASLTASSSLSYFGLNVTVKAQSMIRPAKTDTELKVKHTSVDVHVCI